MRTTIRDFKKMKDENQPIAMITAYDAMSAQVAQAAGVAGILVGDSLGMVVQGYDTPIPVKLEHIIYHASIVVRLTQTPLIVGDLPFMTYSVSSEQALINAGRLVQEGGVGAVKLEGGEALAPTIKRMVEAGIPVMAHIGLTPQSVHRMGGMRVQGKDLDTARQLLRDAEAVEDAGAFAVVLEGVPAPLAEMITDRLHIPTIGIGAGPHCSGQIQVFHDLFGLLDGHLPRHARQYAQVGAVMREALTAYVQDVQQHSFPTQENSFTMKDDVLSALQTQTNGADGRASR
jgi:3-methyl-2-oxobutanoate hydroxymethyltransferase